jgi:hypothetical protein
MIALRRVYNSFLPVGAAILVGIIAVCFFATSHVLVNSVCRLFW